MIIISLEPLNSAPGETCCLIERERLGYEISLLSLGKRKEMMRHNQRRGAAWSSNHYRSGGLMTERELRTEKLVNEVTISINCTPQCKISCQHLEIISKFQISHYHYHDCDGWTAGRQSCPPGHALQMITNYQLDLKNNWFYTPSSDLM